LSNKHDHYSAPVTGLIPETVASSQKDKKVKLGRRKSAYRDADFMRQLQALPAFAAPSVSPETSVTYTTPRTPSHTPTSTPIAPVVLEALRRFIASLSPKQQKEAKKASAAPRARHPRWYEHGGMFGAPIHPERRAPTPWRDASDYLKLEFYHRALKALGPVYTLNLNLRHDVEAQARRQKNPGDWLRRRIALALKSGLGRAVDFYLVFEEDPDHFDESTGRKRPRLHIHGEFRVSSDDIKEARACLRKAGGEWEEARQHQVKAKPAPDEGWIGYCTKEIRGIENIFWDPDQLRLNFQQPLPGSMLSVTRPVTAKAKEIFEKERASMSRQRRRRR